MKKATARAAVAALACAVLAVSCTAPSDGTARSAPSAPDAAASGRGSADPFETLVSRQNGLFYHPFLRTHPTSAQDQSFALRTLREAGARPTVELTAAVSDEVRSDALAVSAVWGRYWLIAFRDAGARNALTGADAEAVERLYRPGGWYEDPALGDDPAQRLSATCAALEVLDAVGRPGPDKRREATARWLTSLADGDPGLEEAGAIARSLRLLGRPVPARLKALKAPPMADFGSLSPDERAQRLLDTYGYVTLAESAGIAPEVDRTAWRKALGDNAEALEYDQLYYLARVLRAGGEDGDVLRPVVRRLESSRLPDGTVGDPSSYVGTGDASLFVQLLRTLAGDGARDVRLARAVREEKETDDAPDDPVSRITRAALLRSAAGDGVPQDVRALCTDGSVVPSEVTQDDAVEWQRMVLLCAEAGAKTPAPAVTAWPVRTRQQIRDAAALVDGLTLLGTEKVPAWVDTAALRRAAINPEAGTPLYEQALAALAYLRAGGKADAALLSALRSEQAAQHGCPGLPGLYRIGAGDQGCDLKTTWAVRRLDRQLDGRLLRLPDGTHAPSGSEKQG
ncbi:hypothetical protein [Streptomyces bacillaris]|uniref:hypothetical protein n=1 Tax=Streptomyces bacillaris TaxID=68179 RepID=UPI0037034249